MEASRAAPAKGKKRLPSKADVALSHIRKLYAVEKATRNLGDAERYRVRQEKSLPLLKTLKTWLETNVGKVIKASATCYSLIETAKANELEPSAYLYHVLKHIAEADTVEKLEALLPWNAELPASKKVAQYR